MDTISIIGCGWLGLPLGKYLVERGYSVKGSTTSKDKLPILRKEGIEAFLFEAGKDHSQFNSERLFQADILILNIPPRRRILNIEKVYPDQIKSVYGLAKTGSISKVLFVSSTGVYGNGNRVVLENEKPMPEHASGKALVRAESFLQEQETALSILRLAGLVGGDRKAGRFLAGKKQLSGAKAPINLIHREDCIQIIYEIIRQDKWGLTLNASADEHPEKALFYKSQAQKLDLEPPTFIEENQSPYKMISNEKLKRELNYSFTHPDPMDF